jgi:hypothetical protein
MEKKNWFQKVKGKPKAYWRYLKKRYGEETGSGKEAFNKGFNDGKFLGIKDMSHFRAKSFSNKRAKKEEKERLKQEKMMRKYALS